MWNVQLVVVLLGTPSFVSGLFGESSGGSYEQQCGLRCAYSVVSFQRRQGRNLAGPRFLAPRVYGSALFAAPCREHVPWVYTVLFPKVRA